MNSKVLNYLSEKKDSFMDWFEANKTNIKTNATKVIATGLTLAALTNIAGCKQLAGSDGPHTKHPMISDDRFTGETLPPTIEAVRPKEEITVENITAEDVLATYDQLSMLALHHYWANSKEQWGEDFSNVTATFNSITPNFAPDNNLQTGEQNYRMTKYYTYSDFFDGRSYWQHEPQNFSERVYTVCFNMDIGYKGEIFDWGIFDPFGILESDFLPIAEGFHSEPFEITKSKLEELYGTTTTITNIDHGQTGYSSFIIDRNTILNITDKNLLWALYNAAHNSLYSINFNEHYNKHNNIEMEP